MKYKEKKFHCGKYIEIDIIPHIQSERRSYRGKRIYLSSKKQRNLNDKNAKRYFVMKVNANFSEKDYYVTLEYKKKYMPKSLEEAEREIANFFDRLRRKLKKIGKELKYIVVTETKEKKTGTEYHHHLIMNGDLSREEVEDTWRVQRKKGEKQGELRGYCNTRRLQPNEYGYEAVAKYMAKDSKKGKKRWSCSKNLKNPKSEPYYTETVGRISKKKVDEMAKIPDDREYWEKKYKGYLFTECKPVFSDITGKWSLYIKMRKREGWKDESGMCECTSPDF